MNCLITGGAGFIGSNLAEYLLRKGWQVRILDNLSTGKMENLTTVKKDVDFIKGDIRDQSLVGKAVLGCPIVFHQAALPSVLRSITEPLLTHDVNVNGTLNVLLAAQRAGVKRLIFASSSSVYGDSEVLPRSEEIFPCPLSPYAVTKLTGEFEGLSLNLRPPRTPGGGNPRTPSRRSIRSAASPRGPGSARRR